MSGCDVSFDSFFSARDFYDCCQLRFMLRTIDVREPSDITLKAVSNNGKFQRNAVITFLPIRRRLVSTFACEMQHIT